MIITDANRIAELDDQFTLCREVNLQHRNAEFVDEAARFRAMYESRLPDSQPYEPLVLRMEGALLHNQDRFEEAIKVFEYTLDRSRVLGDAVSEAMAHLGIGNCFNGLGRYAEAVVSFQKGVETMDGQDSPSEWLSARAGLAGAYMFAGEYPAAIRLLEENIAFAREHNEPAGELWAMSNLAGPYFYMGDYASAIRHTLASYDLAMQQGNERLAMQAAGNVSYVASEIGAIDMARRWIKPVLAYEERAGLQRELVNTRLNALRLEVDADPNPENIQVLAAAIDGVMDTPQAALGAEMVPYLVDTYLSLDQVHEAVAILDRWNARADETQFGPALQSFRRVRLAVRVRQGDLDGALDDCDLALEISREQNATLEVEKLLELRSRILRAIGLFEQALDTYQEHVALRFKNEQGRSLHAATALEVQHEHDRLSLVSEKQQDLLSSVMPNEIVERLMNGEENIADAFDDASVMFLDLVSFTDLSSSVPPAHLIHLLNAVFSTCDDVVNEHGLTKIKTIGDSYLAVSGLPHAQEDHAQRMANAALDLMSRLKDLQVTMPPELGDTSWIDSVGDLSIRIGLHCGPVVAGVIGRHRAQYDVWGDTVNTASRMESSGEPDRIHISEDFAMKIAQGASPEFEGTDVVIRQAPLLMRLRGTQKIKGKGDMKTFWLEGA